MHCRFSKILTHGISLVDLNKPSLCHVLISWLEILQNAFLTLEHTSSFFQILNLVEFLNYYSLIANLESLLNPWFFLNWFLKFSSPPTVTGMLTLTYDSTLRDTANPGRIFTELARWFHHKADNASMIQAMCTLFLLLILRQKRLQW